MGRLRYAVAAVVCVGLGGAIGAGCAEATGTTCELNSDCVSAYCRDGECVRDCVDATLDCPKGYVCNAIAQCEFAGGTGGAGPTGATGSTGSGVATTAQTGVTSAVSSSTSVTGASSSSGGPVPQPELSLCANDGDCASGLCRSVWKTGGDLRCTRACSTHADCGSGQRCETVGAESYCVPSDVGRSCTLADECFFACVSGNQYCTSTCDTGRDCPSGYGCMPVGSPAVRVCVRANADCAADTSQCIVPAACDDTLVVSSCTLACDSAADCPARAAPFAPWTCDGVCRRPGDVYGPLPGGYEPAQWACNASLAVVNVCGDGLHIDFDAFSVPAPPAVSCASSTTTDGVAGDACLESCRLKGGCPTGYGCAGVAETGGQRIGLCMHTGTFEVGEACTKHGDCVFGVCEGGACSRDCSADGLCPGGSTCTPIGGSAIEGVAARRCL